MIGYIRSVRAVRRARAAYALAVLETQIAENARRMKELRGPEECRWCKAADGATPAGGRSDRGVAHL